MTALAELLAPATRAALEQMSRDLVPTSTRRNYAAVSARGGATLADQVSELHIRAAFMGHPLGGAVRYAWSRRVDCVGRGYYSCRVMWWGRYDLNASKRVTATTLPALWDALADRGYLPRDAWADDDAFAAFVMSGNVTPRHLARREAPRPIAATACDYLGVMWSYRRYRDDRGQQWQLVRRETDRGPRWQYVPRDSKRGDI